MKILQNITFTVKLSGSPLKMSTIMYFSEYVIRCFDCFALQLIWFLKRFFCDTRSRACETRSESREVTVRV